MKNSSITPVLQQRQVTDAETGKPAYTYLAPEGWDIKDGVVWNLNNKYNPAQLYVQCYNNDGLTIQVQPGYVNYYWANPMGNSGNTPPRDIRDALKIYLSWFRGVAMDFTEATVLSSAQQPSMPGTVVIQQYGRIRASYEKNGIRFDEIVYATMTLTHSRQVLDLMGNFNEDISWDMNEFVHSCGSGNYSPEAGLETAFNLKQSVRQTQLFYDYEQQIISQLLYQQQKPLKGGATTTINPVSTEKNKDNNDIKKDTWKEIFDINAERMERDRIAFEKRNNQFLDNHIREVEPFTDGKGNQYDLPKAAERAWISSLKNIKWVDKDSFYSGPIDTSYETWTRLSKKY